MDDLGIKNLVGKKIENLKAKVRIKELQLEALLDITNSINSNFSTGEVVKKYKYFVKDQLKIEKLVLFSHMEEWKCLLNYGFEEKDLAQIDLTRDLLHLKEITSVNSQQEDALKNFDIVIPVYQGEKPLAYLLLADNSNEDLSVSKLIKHLNFLQLLTNITVTAIEEQRLSRELLRQEKERREFMERQNEILEGVVLERTKELRNEKEESERLLYNIIPEELADELKQKGYITPLRFKNATVMFTDFKGFTVTSSLISPQKLVNELNDIFQAFDFITDKYNIEKIKTIGDSYMAVCGLPKESPAHAIQCVRAAMEMIRFLQKRKETCEIAWEMRIGIHSGPLVAGVVGTKKFTYDVWGDTVNIASRMESSSIPGSINISEETFGEIKDYFECEYRGKLAAKGKGEMKMYFVTSEKEPDRYTKVKSFILDKLKNELPGNLFYHGLHHTLDVCDVAAGIALKENIDSLNSELIKVAALFHDSGFIKQYQENEIIGCGIAREILPGFNYREEEINLICGMIMATKIPQTPRTHFEKILADADLDYFGRADFFVIEKTLFEELNANGHALDEKQWNKIQIDFLKNHTYFTKTVNENRCRGKQKHVEKLISMLTSK